MKKITFLFSLLPTILWAAPVPVDVTADKLDIQHSEGKAVFTGNVHITQGNMTLTAPQVTATYGANGEGDIQQMQATGGATITRTGTVPEVANGTTATYLPASQQLILTGEVQLTRGPSTLSGDKLVYDMASGNAKVTNSQGPVRAKFVPK